MHRILMAGLPDELASWLERGLGSVAVRATHSGEETLGELGRGDWSLLIIDHKVTDPAAVEVLSKARIGFGLAKLPVVYCLDRGLGSTLAGRLVGQLGVSQLLFHPLDRAELARQAAVTLGMPLPLVGTGDSQAQQETMAAVAGLWERFKGVNMGRVAVLERAAMALLEGALDADLRQEAEREAHKLAGSVGTFGFAEGSRLARELEHMFQAGAPLGQPQVLRLSEQVVALRRELERAPAERQVPEAVSPDNRSLPVVIDDDQEGVTELVGQFRPSESKVMAVDDDPQVLTTLRALLVPRGIRLTTLDDPLRFWDTLEEASPNLLVLDVEMPYVSGIELCRAVRNDPRWSGVPVMFLTALTHADAVHRVFAAGADDFVSKPIVGPELVARIANRLERTQLLRRMAETDPLTGAATRHRASQVLAYFLRLAERHGQPLCVAILDLDPSQQINDRYNHSVGDKMLQRLGELLLRSFRASDVVARWGEEEFVVAMYGMTRADGMQRLAQVLQTLRQEEFIEPDGARFQVTFSGGVAEHPTDGADLQALYRAAEEALYQAKAAGGARVVLVGWRADRGQAVQSVDVVVVDDDEALAGLLLHTLQTRGYRTHWLQDGQAAAVTLGGPSPSLRTRVVLLDVDLPGLDGLSVLRCLARDGVVRRTRVIMLTARSAEAEVLEALELGAFDHVAKPFSIPVLMQRVRRALQT